MNRIETRFDTLKKQGRKGLVVYIGAGDPNLNATEKLALGFDSIGVDVLELGVPFSDPLADGIVNQLAAQRGLASGTTPSKLLETVKSIRKRCQIPIVLYIYFNLIHRQGMDVFIQTAANAGVDGILALDLPPEEAERYNVLMKKAGLCPIYLIAPTTPESRTEYIVKQGVGFIYYVSREGVTGMRDEMAKDLSEKLAQLKKHTELPIAVGFGISTPQQAATTAALSDAVVVGSAIVNQIAEHGQKNDLVEKVLAFTKPLVTAVKSI